MPSHKKVSRPMILLLVLALVVLIVSVFFLVRGTRGLWSDGRPRPQSPLMMLSGSRAPLSHPTLSDIEMIDGWMTFGYISYRYSLPRDLLRDELHIDDNRYPDVPIRGYARRHDIDADGFILEVRKIVSHHYSLIPTP